MWAHKKCHYNRNDHQTLLHCVYKRIEWQDTSIVLKPPYGFLNSFMYQLHVCDNSISLDGHPSKYWPCPLLLSFDVFMATGVSNVLKLLSIVSIDDSNLITYLKACNIEYKNMKMISIKNTWKCTQDYLSNFNKNTIDFCSDLLQLMNSDFVIIFQTEFDTSALKTIMVNHNCHLS